MKHISITMIGNMDFHTTSSTNVDNLSASISIPASTSKSKSKQFFYNRAINIFEKMVETETSLIKEFKRTNSLLQRVYYQFDHLIKCVASNLNPNPN
jgi:hypothetical protein